MQFANRGTEDVYNQVPSKAARAVCPAAIINVARRKLYQLATVESLDELRVPPGNHLEALRGNRLGQHFVRINDQYRVCFRWTDGEPEDVEIVDYH
ncbi:MAG: type II toxin-antitoxin system RelE/ParE family toxin, partial [Candidatus Baltobacteraceae bacterium]